ncbi:hypothetical protein H8K32_07850 [Undibacterium jejuense]|uniref:Uncharacterized protein n=1 Tax=Undibacterium jejuense TaxID=1344949 RepID=A0A923KKK1_9BURK|nr:hypothetical protein [Undibacterium jejuense]MBC3862005.1 hypothetical protein [Undibacterium jejuense]
MSWIDQLKGILAFQNTRIIELAQGKGEKKRLILAFFENLIGTLFAASQHMSFYMSFSSW